MPRGGFRPGSGRKPGSLSLATEEVRDLMKKRNFDPFHKLMDLYEDEKSDNELRVKIASELARYVAPHLKSVDVHEKEKTNITVVLGLERVVERPMVQVNEPQPVLEGEEVNRWK